MGQTIALLLRSQGCLQNWQLCAISELKNGTELSILYSVPSSSRTFYLGCTHHTAHCLWHMVYSYDNMFVSR